MEWIIMLRFAYSDAHVTARATCFFMCLIVHVRWSAWIEFIHTKNQYLIEYDTFQARADCVVQPLNEVSFFLEKNYLCKTESKIWIFVDFSQIILSFVGKWFFTHWEKKTNSWRPNWNLNNQMYFTSFRMLLSYAIHCLRMLGINWYFPFDSKQPLTGYKQ